MIKKLNNPNAIPPPAPPEPAPAPPPEPESTPPVLTPAKVDPPTGGKILTKHFDVKAPGAVSIRVLSGVVFLNDGRKNFRIPRVSSKPVSITITLS